MGEPLHLKQANLLNFFVEPYYYINGKLCL